MNTNNVIHDNDLLMHLNVCQVKALIKSVFQESLSIQQKQSEILSIEEVSELTGYKKLRFTSSHTSEKFLITNPHMAVEESSLKKMKSINGYNPTILKPTKIFFNKLNNKGLIIKKQRKDEKKKVLFSIVHFSMR